MEDKSNRNTLKVHANSETYIFNKKKYVSFFDGLLTSDEVEVLFSEANKVVGVCYSKKKNEEIIGNPRILEISNSLNAFMIILFAILSIITANTDDGTKNLFYTLTIITLALLFTCSIAASIYNILRKLDDFEEFSQMIAKEMKTFIEITNIKYGSLFETQFTTEDKALILLFDLKEDFQRNNKRRLEEIKEEIGHSRNPSNI